MDFELDAQQVVEAAAKKRTTIQQVPSIITVVTAKEIRDRGHRTISDVLRTIPGFDADRWEFNGWLKDNITRGQPRTALVLLDGINIVDPSRNGVVLDRKIPLDIVRRVEVTSGPGGVLWGSNALLGVINIITHDGRTKPGMTLSVGAGNGPGATDAARFHASYGSTWKDDLIGLFVGGTYYTTRGPEMTLSQPKLVGPLPSPSADGPSQLHPGFLRSESFGRDHFFNLSGRLRIGPVTLGWMTGYEAEYREVGPGGTPLAVDFREEADRNDVGAERLVTRGSDQINLVYLRFNDRYLGQSLGVNANVWFVHFQLREDPFGVFPRIPILPEGATTTLETDGSYRTGLNLDIDYALPWDNRLLVGGEVFADISSDVFLTSFNPLSGRGATVCQPPFVLSPDTDPLRPCSVTENALAGTHRIVGALYAKDDWKVSERFAVEAGVRGQFASTYDPALLLSAGFVVGLADNVFLKGSFAEGFRPPDFQSTSTSDGIASGVTFEANPGLDVERSRAVEVELNTNLFEGARPIRRWYLRVDYSFTRMENVISFPAGRFVNSGKRDIHSVELLSKLHFYGDHELWLAYYFVDVVDSELGRLRNIPNHILNLGGRLSFFDGKLHVSTLLTIRGSMEDLNRTTDIASPAPLFSIPSAVEVNATGMEVTRIDTAYLWRIGVEGRNLFGVWSLGGWLYNALNNEYSDADFFFDDRIMSRPQPKPGLSFFVETSLRW